VVVVLTDATQLGVDQDARIAARRGTRARGDPVVNKWDLVQDKEGEARRLREEAERHLQHVDFAPLLFVSALEGTRGTRSWSSAPSCTTRPPGAFRAPAERMGAADAGGAPGPALSRVPGGFSYAYQVATQPVTIAIQCNRPQAVDASYRRFLVNRLRDRFQLRVPVRLVFRQRRVYPARERRTDR